MDIGFIGLGNMGGPMALNLLKAGHNLTVYDLSANAVAPVTDAGATAVNSVAEVAAADPAIIITMLPASSHVKAVYLDRDGLLARVRPRVLLIDASTIDPITAREVAGAAGAQGNAMLDAPVSGGTGGAVAGTLTFMVGGEGEDFERARPVLEAMGKKAIHCGPSGNGQVAKVSNNMLLAISMIGVAEAMSLGVGLGMDPKVLAEVLNTSTGRCWSSDTYNPFPGVQENVPASRGYTGGFGTDLMVKDLGLATEAARHIRQPVVLGALAQQLYQGFSAQGNGALDFSAIIRNYRKEQE
ncbi:3-hydroxyisobutyrate dehydrogenase [Hydrocarboniclastica marina]|uniref:3-hydroxyisobutyrate dehydrogenase n=1 Tax=Hydrocarboniclastica marina TaxID=2259620 RepID=A0A4P7XJF2_9ALTE|nr:3-hydroxyisobutyrate dehydrogenase [Hydrocarboniclastica marina]QCF27178.1 3-hydroxyisobutyrate dehydrogenase [Hydrocarboniclastica marina]